MTGDERVVTVGELREAVNACCTCGGAGPGGVCPACDMWYYALRHFAKAPTTPPSAPPLDAKPPSAPYHCADPDCRVGGRRVDRDPCRACCEEMKRRQSAPPSPPESAPDPHAEIARLTKALDLAVDRADASERRHEATHAQLVETGAALAKCERERDALAGRVADIDAYREHVVACCCAFYAVDGSPDPDRDCDEGRRLAEAVREGQRLAAEVGK